MGVNSITTLTGTYGKIHNIGAEERGTVASFLTVQPALGINNIQALNTTDGVSVGYSGTQPFMTMNCQYRG